MLKCIAPPELNDVDLAMFLDGEAPSTIAQHIKQCQYCRERALVLDVRQNHIQRQFFRGSCPEPEMLRDFTFQLLSPAEAATIKKHIISCPHCARDLVNDYVSQQTTSTRSQPTDWVVSVVNHIQVVIAGLLPHTPGLALRNHEFPFSGRQQNYHFQLADDGEIVLNVQMENPDTKVFRIEGSIATPDTADSELSLWQSSKLLKSMIVDFGGDFVFTQITPGTYELILQSKDKIAQIPSIDVG